jgi:hypothetical protein
MVSVENWVTLLQSFANRDAELSIDTSLNDKLVPYHARAELKSRGIDLDSFTPLAKEEMIAKLD